MRLSTLPTSIFEQEDPFPDILITYYVNLGNEAPSVVVETVKADTYVEFPLENLNNFIKHIKENAKSLG